MLQNGPKVRESVNAICLQEFKTEFMHLADQRIFKHRTVTRYRSQMVSKPAVRKELESLQKLFVMAPVNNASNNVTFICKQWYMDQVSRLHVNDNTNDGSAYRLVHDISNEELIREQSSFCKLLKLPSMGGINDH